VTELDYVYFMICINISKS